MPSKKRTRSFECDFIGQTKYFINNSMVERRDPNKMKQIYDKTIHLLYKGVNRKAEIVREDGKTRFKNTIKLCGNGEFSVSDEKATWIPSEADRPCKCCSKAARLHADCSNCNLDLCEFCGLSCINCNEPLCNNCISLFECGTMEQPCCSRCKVYMQCGYF